MSNEQKPQDEQLINGVPARLFDGYDGDGQQPPADYMQKLLDSAPPEFKARAEQFSKEQAGSKIISADDSQT